MSIDHEMAPLPDRGNIFRAERTVRAGDCDRNRALRLDGIARYLQDAGFDHIKFANAEDAHPYWVVRRTVIDVIQPAAMLDPVRVARWCSGISSRWCNMRVRIENDKGALIETEAFWINLNASSYLPGRISDEFQALLGESAVDKKLRWKSWLDTPLPELGGPASEAPFPLRETDIDVFAHVNNAIYWQAVEQHLAARPDVKDASRRAVLEHHAPIQPAERVVVRTLDEEKAFHIWFLVDGAVRAQGYVAPLD
jgi:acyl-ACP thioesterase